MEEDKGMNRNRGVNGCDRANREGEREGGVNVAPSRC